MGGRGCGFSSDLPVVACFLSEYRWRAVPGLAKIELIQVVMNGAAAVTAALAGQQRPSPQIE
jgi:hypothetical protein